MEVFCPSTRGQNRITLSECIGALVFLILNVLREWRFHHFHRDTISQPIDLSVRNIHPGVSQIFCLFTREIPKLAKAKESSK